MYSREDVELALEGLAEGMSVREVSEMVGCRGSTVRDWAAGRLPRSCTGAPPRGRVAPLPGEGGEGAVTDDERAAYEAAMTENQLLRVVLDDLKGEGCAPRSISNRRKAEFGERLRRETGLPLREITAFLRISKSSYEYQRARLGEDRDAALRAPSARPSRRAAAATATGASTPCCACAARESPRSSEPCQYNGQRNRRFLCGQHGFRIGLEGTLEAVEELLHGLCRHAVPDGLVRAEAVVIRLDELDRPALRRGCIRRALVAVPLVPGRPEERLRDRIVVAAAGAAHGEPHVVRCRPGGEPGARVLASAVAVEHGPSCDTAARTGHLGGCDHEACPHVFPYAPADDHARAWVHDHGRVDEAARGPEIGYVA